MKLKHRGNLMLRGEGEAKQFKGRSNMIIGGSLIVGKVNSGRNANRSGKEAEGDRAHEEAAM